MSSANDSYVGIAPDGSGKKIDNAVLNQDGGAQVWRQRVSIGDDTETDNHLIINPDGSLNTKFEPGAAQLTAVPINFSSSGPTAIIAAATGKTTKLYRLWLTVAAPTTLTFEDGSTPLSGPATLEAGGGITLDLSGEPWYTGSIDTNFNINSSNAVQVSGTAYYIQS